MPEIYEEQDRMDAATLEEVRRILAEEDSSDWDRDISEAILDGSL